MMLCYNEEQAKLPGSREKTGITEDMSTFYKSVTVQYFYSYGQKRNRREKMKKSGLSEQWSSK